MTRFMPPIAAVALMLTACSPTTVQPTVTSSSPAGPTVEYSGDRSGQADEKAQQTREQQGKQAVPRSMQPGPTGGAVRSYDCR